MHSTTTDVLLLQRFVPQCRVRCVIARKPGLDWHPVIDLMGQAVDDAIVTLVNTEF